METNFLTISGYDLWDKFVDDSPQGDVFCYSWWLKAVTKDDFKIVVVKENNQIVAGIHAVNYVVYHDKSAYHLLSGGDPQLRSLGGHTLVLWHPLRYFSDKVPVFNFGGSDLQPIEEHVRGFWGTQTQYFHIFNEALVLNREGLRYHGAQMLSHGREIWRDLRYSPFKEHPILSYKLPKHLSCKMLK